MSTRGDIARDELGIGRLSFGTAQNVFSRGKFLGLPIKDEDARGLRESVAHWPPYPDSVEALRRLAHHFEIVAVTNSSNWALKAFAKTLGNPFVDAVTAEDVGANKPHPQVFEFLRTRLSTLGFSVGQVLHVAESQYHDIGIAKRLGFRTCWIERRAGQDGFGATPNPGEITKPDYHFGSLTELVEAVERGD